MVTASESDDSAAQVSAFKAWWWRDNHFADELSSFWPAELDQCAAWTDNPTYQAVSREDVFRVASHDGPHRYVRTAVAAYVWGVGKSAYQIGWLVRAFTKHDPTLVEGNLARVAGLLGSDGAVEAYGSMRRGGANYIKFMGPAFFTKYLFFIGYRSGVAESLPLILDKRVATGLKAWQIRPGGPTGAWARGWPTGGWLPSRYASYIDYATRQQDKPEIVEMNLFLAGDRKGTTDSRPDHWSAE